MKINNKTILVLVMIGLLYGAFALGSSRNNISRNEILTDNAITDVATGLIFEGRITNKNVEPMVLEGVGVYDRNCVMMANGLTDCHGGIETSKYGVIDFNYRHNMAKEPCIAPKEKFIVTILNSAGDAKVQRMF